MGNLPGRHKHHKEAADKAPKPPTHAASPRSSTIRNRKTVTGFSGQVTEKYKVNPKVLGEGHYGTVRKCTDKNDPKAVFALKTIKKSKVRRMEYLRREIDILLTVNHPNIIDVVDIFEDENDLHIVTELCTGGELFDRIIAKTKSVEGHYSERDAATLIKKTLLAIEHCHNEHDIVHRDLKPENFLFKTKAADAEPVIIDFGLSKTLETGDDHMTTRVGTPYYIAPEVLGRNYTKACDIWSIGVICYILLCGYPPFFGDSDSKIFQSIMRGKFDFPSPEWDSISQSAKDFIRRMLTLDADERPTASMALTDPWFDQAADVPISTMLGPKLASFIGANRLKKHAMITIAEHLTETDIGELRELFRQLDVDSSGTLTVSELQGAMADYPEIAKIIDDLMEGIDLDHDHAINYEEFIAASVNRNVFIREENIRLAFATFDKDHTGYITLQNLVEVFGSEAHAHEVLQDVDVSHDGRIDYNAFKAMMEQKSGPTNELRYTHAHTSNTSAAEEQE